MKRTLAIILSALALQACGIYSFTGTSIDPDVHTISIEYIENKAQTINPSLSNDITEALRTKYKRMTRLEEVETDGDLILTGKITGYAVSATAISATEQAAQNRLTVTIQIDFENTKHPEQNVNQSFTNYADFDATNSLAAVESTLCAEIIDKLVEDIFNATVAQW